MLAANTTGRKKDWSSRVNGDRGRDKYPCPGRDGSVSWTRAVEGRYERCTEGRKSRGKLFVNKKDEGGKSRGEDFACIGGVTIGARRSLPSQGGSKRELE